MAGDPLRIFVAMPGTSMGSRAEWHDIEEIKRHLLHPVAERLTHELQRPVTLDIETDKNKGGNIYSSMFAEALNADVYIADLSGDNPNVFLELGVRWALADNTTILITQDPDDAGRRFNVASARAIRYGAGPALLGRSIDRIVATVREGLSGHVDSVVREHLDVVTVRRDELERLRQRVQELQAQRGEDHVVAARTLDGTEAVKLLEKAVELNPASLDAWYELGVRLRRLGKNDEAAASLRKAIAIDDMNAEAWRELGVTLSKGQHPKEAIEAFEKSLLIDPASPEALANVAGLHRRTARRGDNRWDLTSLARAAECYNKASELNRNDTYPRVNAAKVRLLLAEVDPTTDDVDDVLAEFRRLRLLTEFTIQDLESKADDDPSLRDELPWKYFDLVDCLLVSGTTTEVQTALERALASIRPGELGTLLSSVVEPWRDFAALRSLDGQQTANLRWALDRCARELAA